jgi:hypothetical protein
MNKIGKRIDPGILPLPENDRLRASHDRLLEAAKEFMCTMKRTGRVEYGSYFSDQFQAAIAQAEELKP